MPAPRRRPCSIATPPTGKASTATPSFARFVGWLHADGYAGFGRLYEIEGVRSQAAQLQGPPRVAEVACWAHARRGFFDVYKSNDSAIAKEALDRIGALFDIERLIAGSPAERRRSVRQRMAKPKIDELGVWLDAQLQKIPGKSDLAGAIRYARWRWDALCRYLDDGRLELSNNAAENQIRPVALGRKNWLFAGSDFRRRQSCPVLHAHTNRRAQRHRGRGIPARRHRPRRRAPGQPPSRVAALEHCATGDA